VFAILGTVIAGLTALALITLIVVSTILMARQMH